MKSKERFSYIFAISALILVILIMIVLYQSGMLYASNIDQISTTTIGSTTTIEVKEGQSEAISFDISGAVIPGEKIKQNINIKNSGQTKLYLRAKAFSYTIDRGIIEIGLNKTSDWVFIDDYYYLKSKIEPNQTVGLSSELILNQDYAFTSKQRYFVNILIESLEDKNNVEEVWKIDLNELGE